MDSKFCMVMKYHKLSWVIVFLLFNNACNTRQCEYLKNAFNSEWNHKIVNISESKSKRNMYVLETSNGIELEIKLPQAIITNGQIGDSIYKAKKSLFAFVYRNNRFIFITRIASPTCDEFIIKHKVNNGNQGVIPSDLELKMMPKRFLKDSLFKYYMSLKRLSEEEKKNLIFVND